MHLQKFNSIEALRFFCMLVICYWHCFTDSEFLRHGNIAVEWFFVLSGMLLYGSYTRHKDESTLDYTLRKYIRFAPEYLLVLGFCYLRYDILPPLMGHRSWDFDSLLRAIPEALMVQDIGFFQGGMNHPLWYVCVLLVGGAIVHSTLRNYGQKALSLLLPLLVIVGYTYLFYQLEHGCYFYQVTDGIKLNLLRGVCDMSLGVLVAHAMYRKQDVLAKHRRMFDAFSIIGLVLSFLLFFVDNHYLPYAIISIVFMLIGCFIEDSTLNRLFSWKVWAILGALSWEMLIIHARVSIPAYEAFIHKLPQAEQYGTVIYGLVVVVSAFALKLIYGWLQKKRWLW